MSNTFDTTLKKIKSRGYWTVRCYPSKSSKQIIDQIISAKEEMRNLSIHLRGWDYPHYPTHTDDNQDLYVANDKVEAWIDHEQFKEVWRLYDNGQFIHLFGLREDWWEEDTWLSADHPLKKIKPGEVLEVVGSVIYSITEMYAFFANLVRYLDVDEMTVEISLNKTMSRKLNLSDPGRIPLSMDYKARVDTVILPKKVYSKEQLTTDFASLAYDQIVYIFHQFNWGSPPLQVIKEDQKKLIERRT